MSSSEEDELLEVFGGFVEESLEALDHCEPLLVRLNGVGGPPEDRVVGDVYRLFHGMKGSAGFLQLHVLVRITHFAETVLGRVREGYLQGSTELADVLVRTCDVLRHRIEVAATTFADAPETESDRSIMADLDAFTGT